MQFELMSYEDMVQMILNSKLDVYLEMSKSGARKELAGFSRLDLIGLSKEVSPIILSLVLNLDDLFLAMFTLIRKNASGPEYLKSAPLMSACCVNGREDLARQVIDAEVDKHVCWSKEENIYPIHIAANFLNTDTLDLVLDEKCDVNITSQHNESPFFLASAVERQTLQNSYWTRCWAISNSVRKYEDLVEESRLKTLTLLQQKGADVNNHPKNLPSSLAFSCKRNCTSTVQFMIRSGANVKEPNNEKLSVLHFASEVGNSKIVHLLLESGAGINNSNTEGRTPLYLASLNGHTGVVVMLLSKGITEESTRKSKYSPFVMACKHGHIRIVEKFLERDNCTLPNDTPALLAAVQNGHEKIVELLLKNGADASMAQYASKISPLYSAAGLGYNGILKLLLKKGVNIDMETKNANTALDVASQNGHYSSVQILLEKDANVNHCNAQRQTPLYYAAENGHYEIMMLLLEKGADVNICTKKENSALMRASWGGYENMVCELLSHGADVNHCNVAGKTALFFASEGGHIGVVKRLLASKADVTLANKDGNIPLYIASRHGHHGVVQELLRYDSNINGTKSKNPLLIASYFGHYKTVKILLENGANVNVQGEDGDSSLINASRKGWTEIVRILLKFGADATLRNEEYDENALHLACFLGRTDVVEVLLDHGMDIDDHDEDTYTPLQKAIEGERVMTALFLLNRGANGNIVACDTSALYLAIDNGFREIVNSLLKLNVDVNPKNDDGSLADSPHYAAVRNGYYQITKELLRRGANMNDVKGYGGKNLLMRAIESQNSWIEKLLIEHGADVNERDKYDNTALHASAYYDDGLDSIVVLLKNNAKPNVFNHTGTTPMMMALETRPEKRERIQALIDHGANVNARDNAGNSALHFACSYPDKDNVVQCLLKNGADVNARNGYGHTALYEASASGILPIVRTLLRYGADINLCSKDGFSPLDIATKLKKNRNIKSFLQKKIFEGNNNSIADSQRKVVSAQRSSGVPVLPRKSNFTKSLFQRRF
jgi:ankyrin repeat protein